MKTKIRSVLISVALICSAAALRDARAVNPPPDGGYPNFTTAEGTNALKNLTTGAANTAVGWFSLFGDTTASFNTGVGAGTLLFNNGDQNTAVGAATLLFNTIGLNNTAVGAAALSRNIDGNYNTAIGANALQNNTGGVGNTANGYHALYANTGGNFNTANGHQALASNTTGTGNTANGVNALVFNTTGAHNAANGDSALYSNNTGDFNTANGYQALFSNTTGGFNTAIGHEALLSNVSGMRNIAIGSEALKAKTDGDQNVAIGNQALNANATGYLNTAAGDQALAFSNGHDNTALGFGAGGAVTTASNVVCIGSQSFGRNESDSCFITNIWNLPGGSQAVYVDGGGKLGFQVSSRRFKDEIKPMEQASEVIYGLKPVSFRYKPKIDPSRPLSFGLIAEEVEKTSPDLVIRDADGSVSSVRYDAVNAMLLNEFLKEHRKVQKLEAVLDAVTARLNNQERQLQKVSALLKTSKASRQVASR